VLDLRIVNGVVVTDGAVAELDVGIEGGTISDVGPSGSLPSARVEIDATGLHVLPGSIDAHFHCRAPSHPERGDFASETAAAAAGGVTTVFEMPISDPACSTPAVFRSRRDLAGREAHVNVALFSGAALGDAAHAEEMAALGAIAFKLFTLAPPPGREREFDGLWANTESGMLEALAAVASTDLPCVVHAENEALVRYYEASDPTMRRPSVVEAVAIETTAAIAREVDARVHVAHVSSRGALAALRAAHAAGGAVTGETCPQYLLLDASAVDEYGGVAKIAPPLAEPEDVDALWAALRDGTLELVASDHSPFLLEEKAGVPYAESPRGLPTVELLLPALLDAAARGALPLELAVSLVTAAPARLFGLFPQKGTIAVGADADLAIVSLQEQYRPRPDVLVTRAAGCGIVYDDVSLQGRVKTTLVGGQQVFGDGRAQGTRAGRFTPGPRATALEPV
jgi:dihydroorotase (multifunctional complex type)